MQRKRLGVVVHVVAVQCSCVVVHHTNPSLAVRPCAPHAAPLRYPTRAGKKRCASGLLGPRGAKGTSVGERRRLPNGVGFYHVRVPFLSYISVLQSAPIRGAQLEALSLV